MKLPHIVNPIRLVAVICVAVTSAYVMVMSYRLIQILSSPDWCAKAIQAERITPGSTFVGLTACIDMLKMQIKSLAVNSYIFGGVTAMCLLTLIVIVIAGGFVSFNVSATGASGSIGKGQTPKEEGAKTVAAAAVAEAHQVAAAEHNVGTGGEDG